MMMMTMMMDVKPLDVKALCPSRREVLHDVEHSSFDVVLHGH